MTAGRPLRFLVAVLAGWVGVRTVLLWPNSDKPIAAEPVAAVTKARHLPVPTAARPAWVTGVAVAFQLKPAVIIAHLDRPSGTDPVRDLLPARSSLATSGPVPILPPSPPASQGTLPSPLGTSNGNAASRWSGGLFAIARPSGGGGGLGSSQLGGSQVGLRVAYALGSARRVAVVGRVATPIEGRGREAAVGVEWRPASLPLRVFAEQRFALDGGRGGPSVGVIGGLDRQLGRGFRLEAYGQAGVIERTRTEGFVDAAARVARPVVAVGPVRFDLGLGAWGGAQRGAERIDIGPTLGVAAPLGGRTVRLALDWRERVVGDARPGSGPALSLGTDF